MGVAILKTVLAPAADYDLTDLATVKDELNIPSTDTSNDTWLGRAISQVSAIVSRYCNRVFLPELLLETQYIEQDAYPNQTPGGIAPLQLSRWPILSLVSVAQVTAINTRQALVQGTDFAVDFDKGQLIRLNPFTGVAMVWEALPTIIEYGAGYGAVAAENQTVPATPGPYTVTVNNAATFSFDGGVTYANGTAFTAVTGTPANAGEYSVAMATGIYSFNAADQGASIIIDYGYSDIPDDLIDAVLRVVTQRFKQKDRDPMLMSINQPGVGEKRWWVGTTAGQNGALPPEITGLLDGVYRVPVIG